MAGASTAVPTTLDGTNSTPPRARESARSCFFALRDAASRSRLARRFSGVVRAYPGAGATVSGSRPAPTLRNTTSPDCARRGSGFLDIRVSPDAVRVNSAVAVSPRSLEASVQTSSYANGTLPRNVTQKTPARDFRRDLIRLPTSTAGASCTDSPSTRSIISPSFTPCRAASPPVSTSNARTIMCAPTL